jgi:hypothetical protein
MIDRFWANYLSRLDKEGVKRDHRRRFVMRVEGFLKAIQPRRLADLGAGDLADDLSRAGRDARLTAWQFRQLVDDIPHCGRNGVGTPGCGCGLAALAGFGADPGGGSPDRGPGLDPAGPVRIVPELRDVLGRALFIVPATSACRLRSQAILA